MDIKREGERPRELRTPQSECVHPRLLEKVGHLAPRIEHAGLHCRCRHPDDPDRKSTRLNSSHLGISYAVFCLKKKKWCHKDDLMSGFRAQSPGRPTL